MMMAGNVRFMAGADGVGSSVVPVRRGPVPVSRFKVMSVKAALEWAFGVECASLDFGDVPEFHVGTDMIWRMMRTKELGCRVDGGGRSPAHADAEIIASFVAALPVQFGGRGMAVQIAELARAARAPDWIEDRQLRCLPVADGAPNQHGVRAKAEDVPAGLPVIEVPRGARGRPHRPMWCRVTYTPTAQAIASAQRNYLRWWGALLELGQQLRSCGRLDHIRVTQDMPVMDPWNKRA